MRVSTADFQACRMRLGRIASKKSGTVEIQYDPDPTLTATYGVWNFWLLKWGGCLGEAARLYWLYKRSPKSLVVYLKRLLKAVGCLWGPTVYLRSAHIKVAELKINRWLTNLRRFLNPVIFFNLWSLNVSDLIALRLRHDQTFSLWELVQLISKHTD